MKQFLSILLGLSVLLGAAAVAHHSFATFDATKQQTIVGTVKDFQWTNPHCWVYLMVPNGADVDIYDIEAGAVVGLKRQGWSKETFKVGDRVTITIHPKRDGTHGGAFVSAITADGKTLGPGDKPLYGETAKPAP
jgi:hypothetical protein